MLKVLDANKEPLFIRMSVPIRDRWTKL